jgi:succinyl-diaminopimelate desuccinylase
VSILDADALAALTLELVEISSVTGDERAAADFVESRCRAIEGVQVERHGNGIVARSGPAGAEAIALVGHLDTVPPWPDHRPYRDGLKVVGRGAADMKGGDAAILAVLMEAAVAGRPLVAVFYDREEGPSHENGIHALLDASELLGEPPFAFVAEPTRSLVHAGCVGGINADVVFHGRTAHSARPWEGENAILKAVPFLARAATVAVRPVQVDGLTFYDTLSVTRAEGGLARNVVPDELVLGLNLRFAPSREAAAVREELERLVGGEGELRIVDESPPASPNLGEPILQAFLAQSGVQVEPKQAWTDVATLQARGIPAVNFGPGEPGQAHQPGEWVDGQAIATVAGALTRFLASRDVCDAGGRGDSMAPMSTALEERTDRRAYPRVRAEAPLFLRSMTQSAGLQAGAVEGRLIDASRGGVAFASSQPVRPGDIIEVQIDTPSGDPCLSGVYARIVATRPHPEHDLIVHCEFTDPLESDSWLANLQHPGSG